MLTNFICPDNEEITTEACQNQCRMSFRCVPSTFLMRLNTTYGISSSILIPDLINGTRMEYLKRTKKYAILPEDYVFDFYGEKTTTPLGVFEFFAHAPARKRSSGKSVLEDTRFASGQKVAQAIGLTKTEYKVPVYEMDGKRAKFKDGPEKGKEMYEIRSKMQIDRKARNIKDWAVEMNMYRIMHERNSVIKLDEMWIFAIIKDSGIWLKQTYGISSQSYMVDIPFLVDDDVIDFFREKNSTLEFALKTKTCPNPCTPEEAWDGLRCQKHCPVAKYCAALGDNPWLAAPTDTTCQPEENNIK